MTDIDIYQPPGPPGQYQAALAMTPGGAKALDDQLRACTKAVLREGTDYGVIPGTNGEQVLLKPGAEKLLQWFGFGFTCSRLDIDHDADGQKLGVTYRCTITKRIGDPVRGLLVEVATCEGYAGYDEGKFYKSAEQAQREAEAKERHWAKVDRRVANPEKWNHLTEYRAPWNTIIKMAQKRAIVGATIDATAAAGLFSQEEDSSPLADDGSTWYEQALEEALTFTDTVRGSKLYTEAAQAARDGLCTPGQANHVQNRAKQRLKLLATAKPVDVEDLAARAAAAHPADPGQDETGPETASDEAAKLEPGESAEYGTERHQKLVGVIWQHLQRLGYPAKNKETDDESRQRLADIAALAGISEITSTSDLDTGELSKVADTLARCRNRAALKALLETGEGDG